MDPSSQAEGNTAVEPLTSEKALELLSPDLLSPFIKSEEQRHPWAVRTIEELNSPIIRLFEAASTFRTDRIIHELNCPLLRTSGWCSGSPLEDARMLARAERQPLATKGERKLSLALHLDNANRVPTPYISFRSSPAALQEHVRCRIQKMGPQDITVIDPAIRLRKGLPILAVAAEMEYYGIQDPYWQGNRYHGDHYVCLWEVNFDEIIWHGSWDQLSADESWYEEIIMPMFRRFRETRGIGFTFSCVSGCQCFSHVVISARVS